MVNLASNSKGGTLFLWSKIKFKNSKFKKGHWDTYPSRFYIFFCTSAHP